MSDYTGDSAAELRIEQLLEIALSIRHPGLMGVTTDEAILISRARMGMARIMLRLAVLLNGGFKP